MNAISLYTLRKFGACEEHTALFARTFGDEAALTPENMERAQNAGLDVSWLAGLLPAPLRAEYERQRGSLRAEYERQRDSLWAEYERQHAPLRAEYERQRGSLRAEYERQRVPLRAEYERQRAPLWAEYERQRGSLLLLTFLLQVEDK
jgi:post-segregation antitoxin (ccd killing protein)